MEIRSTKNHPPYGGWLIIFCRSPLLLVQLFLNIGQPPVDLFIIGQQGGQGSGQGQASLLPYFPTIVGLISTRVCTAGTDFSYD